MPDTLTQQCRTAVRQLRAMPRELRDELTARVGTDVATPLAAAVREQAYGPYGPKVRISVRKGVEPAIVAGGRSRVFSGGAAGVDVFYGNEFGGGKSKTWYATSSPKGTRYSVHRATTRQFRRPPRPFVLSTFAAQRDEVSDAWLAVLDPLLDEWEAGGYG